jgi:hypothetical protein
MAAGLQIGEAAHHKGGVGRWGFCSGGAGCPKAGLRRQFIAALLASMVVATARAQPAARLPDGDIIFHTSRSAQSEPIQRVTHHLTATWA